MNAIRGFVNGNNAGSYDAYMRRIENMHGDGVQEAVAQEHSNILERDGFKFSSEEFIRALGTLDVRTHTIPFIALLVTKLHKDINMKGDRLNNVRHTVHVAMDKLAHLKMSDARFMTDYFFNAMRIIMGVTKHLNTKEDKVACIRAVRNGLIAFDGGERKITILHPEFFQLCIQLDAESIAREVICKNARDYILASDSADIDYVKLTFLYFYLAGDVQFYLGSFRQALHLYLSALMVPMENLTADHCLIYKRFVLLNFILGNAVKEIPSCLQNMMNQTLRSKIAEYDELITLASKEIYNFDNAAAVCRHINSKFSIFEKDNNTELVERVRIRVTHEAVMRVARSFKVISIEKVQKMAFLKNTKETLNLLSQLADDGRLKFDYNEETGFMTITIPESRRPNADVLAAAQKKIVDLKNVVSRDHDKTRSSKFLVGKNDKENMM